MSERVTVVVYDPETGAIRQKVRCLKLEADVQHLAWPGHTYLEVTGQDVHPNEDSVDIATLRIVPRTVLNDGDMDLKRHELIAAADAALPAIEDSASLMLKAAGGDAKAQKTARDAASGRDAAKQKLSGLLDEITKAKTRDELASIRWD